MMELERCNLPAIRYDPDEPSTKVGFIRLPATMYAELKMEARELGTSLNRLCVSKLSAAIQHCLIIPNANETRKNAVYQQIVAAQPAPGPLPAALQPLTTDH